MDPLSESLRGWTPVHVAAHEPRVDWAIMREPPRLPFFEQDAELAMRRPFNRVFARRTNLDVLDTLAGDGHGNEPALIVAHMSRCGSTLVAQMLAMLSSLVVLSEAQPFDAVVRRHYAPGGLDEPSVARALRALVRAFDRGDGRRIVLKLHAWHALCLPLYRRAFPRTPLAFVFREPRAVLRSQQRQPGYELAAGAIPPSLVGVTPQELLAPDYDARVLAAFCDAALRSASDGPTTFVDYAQLPDAAIDRLAPLAGVTPNAQDVERMRERATLDTKRAARDDEPGALWHGPRDDARSDDAIEQRARRLLDLPYAALRVRASA